MADTEVAQVDYSTMTYDQLLEEVGKAYQAKDMKLMGQLSSLATKAEATAEKAKKEALLAELVKVTETARHLFACLANAMSGEMSVEALVKEVKGIAGTEMEGAEGIWFALDFGEKREKGINPACRLVKSGKKASPGGGDSKSSYVANPAKSADLIAQVGGEVMFEEDTTVTIDKAEQIMVAGTTYKEAYDFSTNGGWRNRCRMALLKKAGIV